MSVPAPSFWDYIYRPRDDGSWGWQPDPNPTGWRSYAAPPPFGVPPPFRGGEDLGLTYDPGYRAPVLNDPPPPLNRGAVPQTPQAIQNYQGIVTQPPAPPAADNAFLQHLLANKRGHITAPGQANMDLSGAGVTYTAPADTYRWNWQKQARDPQGRTKGTSNYNKALEWTQQYLSGNQARVSKWGAGLSPEQAFRKAVEQLLAEVRAKGGERAVARTGFQLR